MVKKILETGEELSIVLGKKVLKKVLLTDDMELKITTKNGAVVIEKVPVKPKQVAKDESEEDAEFRAIYKKVIKKYTPALKKLAKN
jgi:antitoxin component of MazEF toxin-antitoxin module